MLLQQILKVSICVVMIIAVKRFHDLFFIDFADADEAGVGC